MMDYYPCPRNNHYHQQYPVANGCPYHNDAQWQKGYPPPMIADSTTTAETLHPIPGDEAEEQQQKQTCWNNHKYPQSVLNYGYPHSNSFTLPSHQPAPYYYPTRHFPPSNDDTLRTCPRRNRGVLLGMECDHDSLSLYQCVVRQQIELFQADEHDVEATTQGRNIPIELGQVGIRCKYCCGQPIAISTGAGIFVPCQQRSVRGAVYYPSKLLGLYQAAQNMAHHHFLGGDCDSGSCPHLPNHVRKELLRLSSSQKCKKRKSPPGGGKKYWAESARTLGVYEADGRRGLRFATANQCHQLLIHTINR